MSDQNQREERDKERSKRDQDSNRRIEEEGERLRRQRESGIESDDWWNPWR